MGGQPRRILESTVRQLLSAGFYHYVGTGIPLRMEPPVISDSKFKGELIILKVILAYINVVAVAAEIVERPACNFTFFEPPFLRI